TSEKDAARCSDDGEDVKERGLASQTILHELLLTELDVCLYRTLAGRPDMVVLETERRYFRKDRTLTFSHQGKPKQVIPDYGFVLRAAQLGGKAGYLLTLVELDNGTSSLKRLRDKFRVYDLWGHSFEGQEYLRGLYRRLGATDPRPQFRLLVVAHDKNRTIGDDQRLLDLFTLSLECSADLRHRMWFGTVNGLHAHHMDSRPLESPLWFRTRDAEAWLPE